MFLGKIGDWYAIYEPETRCVGAVSGQYIKSASSTGKTTTPAKRQLHQKVQQELQRPLRQKLLQHQSRRRL